MTDAKPKIVVSGWKAIDRGSVVGRFELEFTGMGLIIAECLLMQRPDGQKWVSLPSREFTGRDGAKKYFSLVRFRDRDVGERFNAAVVPLVEQLIAAS